MKKVARKEKEKIESERVRETENSSTDANKRQPEFQINTVYNTHNTVGTFDHNYRCKCRHLH